MRKPALFISLFVLSLTLSAQTDDHITLEDIFIKETFRTESAPSLQTMKDGMHYTSLENGIKIVKTSYETGEVADVIFDITKIEDAPIAFFTDYRFSDDETKILLISNVKKIYRYSFSASYYVWNLITGELSPLSEKGDQQLAAFSPDGNYVAFVRQNNLFIKNLKFGSESQITWDGKKNNVINGAPDWVYEEEFGFNKAFWWSPDSKFIAYIRFDESEVPDYTLKMYAGENPALEENMPYPALETYKYPKAGEKNSTVSVKTYELYSKVTIDVNTGEDNDIYVPRLKWTPDSENLVVMRMNRRQNQVDVLYANPFTGDSRPILTEKNDRYIDESFFDSFVYLEDGRIVLTSERDGWSHLYLYDGMGFLQTQLTRGQFDVTDFYGYDPEEELFYYQAVGETPLLRKVSYTSIDKKEQGQLSTLNGNNHAEFSKNFKYYINHYSNSATPPLITVYKTKKNQRLRVLQDNTLLKNKLENFKIPKKEFFKFTTSDGVILYGYMIKPVEFNESGRYPVLISQYSGPASQKVKDSFGGPGWEHFLADRGFLVVSVDPRGTAARGEDFRKITYMQLGKFESADMVETAKYLGTLPYVDKNNIGIFGWSYGGFTTCLSMEKGGSLFKAGIAVAPVTDWRFYDTIYTERYMQKPNENPEGYRKNSPLYHAGDIKGRIMIIHGSADDNVHPQNTYEFAERLVQKGIQFDMAVYTNRNHGINGGNTTMHLYTRMTNFLEEQLQ
jgi:dipeptidyl-peptidase 4